MTLDQILATAAFLGADMTDVQAERLMDEAKNLSIADRERLYAVAEGRLYTEASMHDGEMGGLSRY